MPGQHAGLSVTALPFDVDAVPRAPLCLLSIDRVCGGSAASANCGPIPQPLGPVSASAVDGFLDAPIAAAPVLPKGHPPLPKPAPLRTFTIDSLLTETQFVDSKRLVAVKGAVFDVSADSRFHAGGRWHEAVGPDLTRTLAFTAISSKDTDMQSESCPAASSVSSSSSSSNASDGPLRLSASHEGARALDGLDFDALRTLETWWSWFQDHFDVVGRIRTEHEIASDSCGSQWSRPGEAELAPLPSDIYGSFLLLVEYRSGAQASSSDGSSLHALMDADQRDQARQLIDSLPSGSAALDCPCPRSVMRPLHKAVERDWLDVVESLLAKGADVRVPCALYDGDTAVDMARRFQSQVIVAALESRRE